MEAPEPLHPRIAREREFFNEDHASRDGTRRTFYGELSRRSRTFYFDVLKSLAVGADVLEYGCSTALISRPLAPRALSISAIIHDDSPIGPPILLQTHSLLRHAPTPP